jgi:hypothetical protein
LLHGFPITTTKLCDCYDIELQHAVNLRRFDFDVCIDDAKTRVVDERVNVEPMFLGMVEKPLCSPGFRQID